VQDVYVRRFTADRAVIELTLTEPAPLLRVLRESLPHDVSVRGWDRNRISLDVVEFKAHAG
jgi:hypothetical protein